MADVHCLQQAIIRLVVGVVLAHADLLGDNALLLGHALRGEPRHGYEGQQGAQILLKAPHTVEIVARHGRGGECVGVHPIGRHALEGVPILGIKGLVLQKVGHPRRGVQPFPVLPAEAQIHPAVTGGKKSELLGVFRPHIHVDIQSIGQQAVADALAQRGIFQLVHPLSPPSPSGGIWYPASAFGRPRPPGPPSPPPPP